jgi:nicotinate phosphoribosyltransferase
MPSGCGGFLSEEALLTDLYELTMAAAYFENHIEADASFELFIRHLPPRRSFLVAAGLTQALDYLERLAFSADQIDFLRRHPAFAHVGREFFEFLRAFRFTGDVWAVPEGTPVFPQEPLLRVRGPIIQAQIVETFLLTMITFQTMIASKAARVALSAAGRQVVEFGSRRAHGPYAGVLGARAAYIGGCDGTSNVEAHYRFGIPTFGTLAHSFVMAYDDEEKSFHDFKRVFPDQAVLLVDTYDTLAAVDKIIAAGIRAAAVRLDSGDRLSLSKEVRRRLDKAGFATTKIFVSGDLDENSIASLLAAGAPIDGFGVGTALATSQDAPSLSGVYKLVEFDGQPRMKLSRDKQSYPCSKQVFRSADNGMYTGDMLGMTGETLPGAPLLMCVMREGKCVAPSPSPKAIREYVSECLRKLPAAVLRLENPAEYPVRLSGKLVNLWEDLRNHREEPVFDQPRRK